jgi:hypothetical protein
LKNEIHRLEDSRSTLTLEVETMTRHLENERNRLRAALGDILRWVDENVQPTVRADTPPPAEPAPAPSAPPTTDAAPPSEEPQSGNRPAVAPPASSNPRGSGTGPTGDVAQMRPAGGMTRPAASNAPLPL